MNTAIMFMRNDLFINNTVHTNITYILKYTNELADTDL